MNPNYQVQCCVMGCHGNSLLHLLKKSHLLGIFKGVGEIKYFETSISQWLCRVLQWNFKYNVF